MSLQKKILSCCLEKGYTLSLAESITGGAVSACLVQIPGASRYFQGSIVAYSRKAKEELLEVPAQLIDKFGEVSEEVALHMALGAKKKFHSDLTLSTTGIAGPTTSPNKPVGMVAFGLLVGEKSQTFCHFFQGNREAIIEQTLQQALEAIYVAVSTFR